MSLFKSNKEMYESEDHTNILEFISQIQVTVFYFNKERGGADESLLQPDLQHNGTQPKRVKTMCFVMDVALFLPNVEL